MAIWLEPTKIEEFLSGEHVIESGFDGILDAEFLFFSFEFGQARRLLV